MSREEEETQLLVPGSAENGGPLRRQVMPLPVGFFDAIEAKHVARQAVDYLPQVKPLLSYIYHDVKRLNGLVFEC